MDKQLVTILSALLTTEHYVITNGYNCGTDQGRIDTYFSSIKNKDQTTLLSDIEEAKNILQDMKEKYPLLNDDELILNTIEMVLKTGPVNQWANHEDRANFFKKLPWNIIYNWYLSISEDHHFEYYEDRIKRWSEKQDDIALKDQCNALLIRSIRSQVAKVTKDINFSEEDQQNLKEWFTYVDDLISKSTIPEEIDIKTRTRNIIDHVKTKYPEIYLN